MKDPLDGSGVGSWASRHLIMYNTQKGWLSEGGRVRPTNCRLERRYQGRAVGLEDKGGGLIKASQVNKYLAFWGPDARRHSSGDSWARGRGELLSQNQGRAGGSLGLETGDRNLTCQGNGVFFFLLSALAVLRSSMDGENKGVKFSGR